MRSQITSTLLSRLPLTTQTLLHTPTTTTKLLFSTMPSSPKKVALILAGSGVYDGSEITESASALVHLSRHGASIRCFAPDKSQMHVVNHLTGNEMTGETPRNCLIESARIARGDVSPLDQLNAAEFDAVMIPGGFGVAKNLSDFGVKGADMTVDPIMEDVLKRFVEAKKVIGLCCISPILAAKVIPGVKITMGMEKECEEFPYSGSVEAAKTFGATHVDTEPPCDKAVVDEEKKVVTSAAYMYAGKPHEIDDSVKAMVDAVMKLC